jgi:hypothetical protein
MGLWTCLPDSISRQVFFQCVIISLLKYKKVFAGNYNQSIEGFEIVRESAYAQAFYGETEEDLITEYKDEQKVRFAIYNLRICLAIVPRTSSIVPYY